MLRYTFRRILLMIPVLVGVTFIIFLLQSFTPGDPATLVLGNDATEQELHDWRENFGLNDPLVVQYIEYMAGVCIGDFGVSYRTNKNITITLLERWPTTFLVAIYSVTLAVVLGMVLGIVAALKRNTWVDSVVRILAMLGVSMPNFWFALLLIMQFALKWKILPVSGLYGPEYWILPIGSIGILSSAGIMRITRSSMLDSIMADYIRTARAKGQKEFKIVVHHILRNALIPIVTNIGGMVAVNMGGTIIMEQIFAISGLGKQMISAINQRDYPLLRGCVLLIAITTSVVNLVVDLIYAAIDPRVKAAFKNSVKPIKLFKKAAKAAS